MGEIAEMMLEGMLCEGCGEYMGGGDGFPRRCSGCRKEYREQGIVSNKVRCKFCGKKVKAAGVNDHMRDVHPNRVTT